MDKMQGSNEPNAEKRKNEGGSKMGLVAWGDESVRSSAPEPTYLMAATLLPDGCNLAGLESVKPRGASKLHWRDLADKAKLQSLSLIADLQAESVIVAAAPVSSTNPERARRKCLISLLTELERRHIETLNLESRTLKMNRKDLAILPTLRSMGIISTIKLEHLLPNGEPRLWVPDQIVGAYGDLRFDPQISNDLREAWSLLEQKTAVVELNI